MYLLTAKDYSIGDKYTRIYMLKEDIKKLEDKGIGYEILCPIIDTTGNSALARGTSWDILQQDIKNKRKELKAR